MLVLNAFSLNMVAAATGQVSWREVPLAEAQALVADGLASAVGHASTAAVFGQQLGVEVPAERATIALTPGDRALVGQYRGPRLEEGTKVLPEGASIVWYLVELLDVPQRTSTLYSFGNESEVVRDASRNQQGEMRCRCVTSSPRKTRK